MHPHNQLTNRLDTTRHNSVALDLCVSAAPQGVYTLMGPELGEDGWVKDPVRLEWATGK
jgi:hypothetical protein